MTEQGDFAGRERRVLFGGPRYHPWRQFNASSRKHQRALAPTCSNTHTCITLQVVVEITMSLNLAQQLFFAGTVLLKCRNKHTHTHTHTTP